MTGPNEGLESIAERARRALRDNDEARVQAQLIAQEARSQAQNQSLRVQEARIEEARRLAMEARAQAVMMGNESGQQEESQVTQPAWMQSLIASRGQASPDPEPLATPAPQPVAMPQAPHPAPAPAAEPLWHQPRPAEPEPGAGLVDRRVEAIRLVRDLEPRRSCSRQRVQELQGRLNVTPTESVHYAPLLQRLAEAHAELSRLEGRIEEAQHIIRSSEWLMEMLTDPTRPWDRPGSQGA